MTKESEEIKRLEALLAKKEEKSKALAAERKRLKASIKAKEESEKKWKAKFLELKKESKTKDAEQKRNRRKSQDTTEKLFDLLSRQLKDTDFTRK
ncbi:hypothetical protein PRLR6025_26600 [Prevotella lacticifex]|uniref:hypothetical protein n=1 Tax=Prevotella lacticifex TaxID=2854755 RepID=UPI001CC7828A|nr:hypothetical protein [Prevotella lacticifex]GJG69191.1 hypothetical protein PRLR6025_26600 [Prevotella lacticifex]